MEQRNFTLAYLYTKMKKKSQIQMGETIAIIIIFVLFVSFGLIFYTRMMDSTNQEKRSENLELAAVQVAQKASFLPELQCSEENVRKDNCIDLLKIYKAKDLMTDPTNVADIYYNMFGLANITIVEVFPNDASDTHFRDPITNIDNEITIYSEVPEQKDILTSESTFIPISIADYKEKKYYFGIMIVEVYLKK